LANGGVVTAVIEGEGSVESISQGTRVLSRAPRGSRADGHTVVVTPEDRLDRSERPPIEAVVAFDPSAPICILRVEGQEVTPTAWPVRERRVPPPAASRPWGMHLLALLGAAALVLTMLAFMWLRKGSPSEPDAKLVSTHRASNGLFVAHFPADLEARAPVLPTGVGGVVLEDKPKWISVVIAGFPLDATIARDPWAIQQLLRDEALVNVPKGAARFEEATRRDDTCLGERGAVVAGNLVQDSTRRGHIWSCAFIHDSTGYLTLFMLDERASSSEEHRVRTIIDATELTKLANLGGAPETPPPLVPR
jgi:hypothetical protein